MVTSDTLESQPMLAWRSNFLEKHHKGHYKDYLKEILQNLKWLWSSMSPSLYPAILTLTPLSLSLLSLHHCIEWPRTFVIPSIPILWRSFCAIFYCNWLTGSKVPCPEVLWHALWKTHRPPDLQPLKSGFLSWQVTWLQSECDVMSAITLVWDVDHRAPSVIVVGSWVSESSDYQLAHFTAQLSTWKVWTHSTGLESNQVWTSDETLESRWWMVTLEMRTKSWDHGRASSFEWSTIYQWPRFVQVLNNFMTTCPKREIPFVDSWGMMRERIHTNSHCNLTTGCEDRCKKVKYWKSSDGYFSVGWVSCCESWPFFVRIFQCNCETWRMQSFCHGGRGNRTRVEYFLSRK